MRRRLLRLAGGVLLAGAATAGAGVVTAAPAGADTSFIGWTTTADANPIDLVVDNAAGLGGAHPLSELDLPEDSVDFETGPLGHALASVAWPGSVAGNAGSLSGELPIPSQLAPLLSKANDPVRAESFYPAGPATATYPSGAPSAGTTTPPVAEMTSHTDGNGAQAKAALTDVSIPGLLELQTVQGSSSADVGATADSSATGSFQSVTLLGGLIKIGATTSSASATSDGTSGSGTATTHLGEVTVAGHTVSYGTDGIVLGPAAAGDPLSSLANSLVTQLLSTFNVKIVALPQSETRQGASEQITSGGLAVSFAVPDGLHLTIDCNSLPSQLAQLNAVCHVPDEIQGLDFTVTLARVTASATATPPFDTTVGGVGTDSGFVSADDGQGATDLGSGDLGLGGGGLGETSGAPSIVGSAPPALGDLSPVSLSSPITAGLLLFLLALATGVGVALRRMVRLIEAPAAATCPQKEGP